MQNGVRIRLNPLGGNQLNIREALRLYLPTSATPSVSDDDDDQPTSPSSQPRPRTRAVVDDYDYEDDFIDDGDVDQPDDDDKQQTEFVGFGGFWVGTDDAAKNHPVVDGNRLGNVVLEKLPQRHTRPASQTHSQSQSPPSAPNSAPPQQHVKPQQPASSSGPDPSSNAAPNAPPNPATKAPAATPTAAVVPNTVSHTVQQAPVPTKIAPRPNNVQHGEHVEQQRPAVSASVNVTNRAPEVKGVASGHTRGRPIATVGPSANAVNNQVKAVTTNAKAGGAVSAAGLGVTKTSNAPRSSKSAQALQTALNALQHFCEMKFNDKKPKLNDPVMQDHLHALLRAAISAGEAKLFSDIVREKRVVALSDQLWVTVNKCLRTKRASLETLGHALIWSAREKQREKEVTRVEDIIKGYLQAKRGGAEAVRVEWSDELREMLYEWFCKKKELLAARNQLGSRVKSVKKSVNSWVASLKKSAFQGFSVAEEEIIRAFRAVEEKNKAKKRKREEERGLQKKLKKERMEKDGAPRGEGGAAVRSGGAVANGEVIELD